MDLGVIINGNAKYSKQYFQICNKNFWVEMEGNDDYCTTG